MTKSFRPDVFRADPPTLLGSICAACSRKAFPPRDVCPWCNAAVDEAVPVALSAQGEVYSFTIVRQAPPGLPVPYVLAYVDLLDDDVRVMARVEGVEPEALEIGTPVVLGARADERSADDAAMFVFTAVAA